MTTLRNLLIGIALTGGAAFAQTISCSSDDMRRHYCAADTSGGVTLLKQRSDAACRLGSTWGYDRRGIWVDRGCRADFILRSRGGGGPFGGGNSGYGRGPFGRDDDYGRTITCASDDMRRHYCGADTRGGVRLVRQRSDASCRQGSTWGYDRRGIWVDRGCRADFEVGGGRGYGFGRDRDRDRVNRDRDYRYRNDRDRWGWPY